MRRETRLQVCLQILAVTFGATAVAAQVMQQGTPGALQSLSTIKVGLNPPSRGVPLEQVRAAVSSALLDGWNAFTATDGGTWAAYVDERSGQLEFAEGSGLPWIPGRGNDLTSASIAPFLNAQGEVDLSGMERIARAFLPRVETLLGVKGTDLQLNQGRSGKIADYLWYVDFDVLRDGFVIDGASVVFRINHGNLVQFGTASVPPASVGVPTPQLSAAAARAAVAAYIGGFTALDTVVQPATLKVLTLARQDASSAAGFAFAQGYGLLPVWELAFRRKDTIGTWRARVDAVTGEIVQFGDANEYAQATGGVVLTSPAGGTTSRPMPFTDISTGGTTNSAGVYTYTGNPTTSTLTGTFVDIIDSCGAISLAADGSGNLDFSTSGGTDCTTPGVGGAGNTHSARTQFYWLNRVKEVGRGWLPHVWLSQQLDANVNLNQTCNAYWNGSTVNFFRSGGGCNNTGELPGVSLHEYGHGLDNNDGNGPPPENGSGETVGDFTAATATHLSCIGQGFRATNCGGYGNACTACTGVRDIDWALRTLNTPSTVQNFTQTTCPQPSPFNPNYVGPCGRHAISTGITANRREGHCESYISSQALWDVPNRDLPSPGSGAAWSTSDRLWYLTRATTTSFFVCNTTPATWTSDGCAAGTLFRTYRVADDDDGNLTNGTPHGGAIFAAFNRHNIACASDPGSSTTFAGCTAPPTPTVTLTPSSNQIQVDWTSSGAGVVYDVYRNEAGCNAGFIKIANDVAALTFVDTGVANFGNYFYQVVAQPTGSEACASAPSTCSTATPLPCATPGTPTLTSVTDTGSNQMTVAFSNGAPPAALVNVYRGVGTCASGPTFVSQATGLAASPYLDNTVSGTITYAYKVTGTDATGVCESPQSNCLEDTATGPCIGAPSFAGLATAASAGTSSCGVVLNWAAGTPFCAGPLTYNVYRDTSPSFTPNGGNQIATGVNALTYTDTQPSLVSGTTYYYIVRAVDTSNSVEETNLVRKSAVPLGPIGSSNVTETFEAVGGFDNPGWTHAALTGAQDWVLSTAQSQTPTHSWFSDSLPSVADRVLVSPSFIALPNSALSFFHTFDFEFSSGRCFDGGTLEYSANGGPWTVMPDGNFTAGLFNGTIDPATSNPIAGKRGWCDGTIGPMTQVVVNLGSFNTQSLQLRWHGGDDISIQVTGWFVDSVVLNNIGTASSCNNANGNPPTITPTPDPAAINEDAAMQTVNLAGITAGAGEGTQPLQVTAVSDTTGVIPNPTVIYTSPSSTGSLQYTPVANAFGTANVTITVTDGGPDNDLGTTGDNATTTDVFAVVVNPVNDLPALNPTPDPAPIAEDAGQQSVNLSGITAGPLESAQPLQVTAVSDNPAVIPNPAVTYTSPNATGALQYTPVSAASGTANVTVTLTDGGNDNNLGTPGDNLSVTDIFQVVVTEDATDFAFFTSTPCRLFDTRNPNGPLGGPALAPNATRTFNLAGLCGIPANAKAISYNVTVVSPAATGNLRIYAADITAPLSSVINFSALRTRANNGVSSLSATASQAIAVLNESPGATDVIVDLNGYFQ